jgi:hypothetical protein
VTDGSSKAGQPGHCRRVLLTDRAVSYHGLPARGWG